MAGMRYAKYPPVCSTKTSVHCGGAVKDMVLQVQAMTMLQMQALMASSLNVPSGVDDARYSPISSHAHVDLGGNLTSWNAWKPSVTTA